MFRETVRLNFLAGSVAFCCFIICSCNIYEDFIIQNDKEKTDYVYIEKKADNRTPRLLSKYQSIVKQEGWRLTAPPPMNKKDIELLHSPGEKPKRLTFHWYVLPDKNLQRFRCGSGKYEFQLVDETPFQDKTYISKSGKKISLVVWPTPSLIKSRGSFVMKGRVKVTEDEEKVVKILQETLCVVENGQITQTWYTPRVTTIEFSRKKE